MFHLAYRKKKITNETPLSLFEKVRGDYASLLHSGKGAEGGERYSFIGYEPFMMLESRNDAHEVSVFHYMPDEIVLDVQLLSADTLSFFQSLMHQMKVKKVEKDLPPFIGGGIGFMSYEFGLKLSGITPSTYDDVEAPDLAYCFYDKVIAFDHQMKDIYFIGVADSQEKAQKLAEEVYRDGTERVGASGASVRAQRSAARSAAKDFEATLGKEHYVEKIKKIKKYLKSGDTYQVNFSYRFSFQTERDPWEIYRELVRVNPSPCSLYLQLPEYTLMSSSPERLVSLRSGVGGAVVQTRPIKGTRPRGANAKEDAAMERELLGSEKETAELSMIVDLMRNDLGKICEAKSVKVVRHREIERYSHVMHTVSTVEGKLKKGADFSDVIRAVFPGGSVTGCPKKRTMEIIHELEEIHRDIYCGSAGYVSMNGNMDLNILIRSMLYKDGVVYFHSGGGIVMDSDADAEFDETLAKAQALMEVLGG